MPAVERNILIKRASAGPPAITWVGVGIAVAAFLITAIFVTLRVLKRRHQFAASQGTLQREEKGQQEKPNSPSSSMAMTEPTTFNRARLTASITLPVRALTRNTPAPTDEEVVMHHITNNTVPKPFAPRPLFSSGLPHPALQRSSLLVPPSVARCSIASSISISSLSSRGSGFSPIQKKVRQIFSPLLPDELLLSVSERVTIVLSYTDGWCIVGRTGLNGEVELGAAPAWCFVKPLRGLKMERPMRVDSLGASVQIEDTASVVGRDNYISWSNF